jgi:hypothetical protein
MRSIIISCFRIPSYYFVLQEFQTEFVKGNLHTGNSCPLNLGFLMSYLEVLVSAEEEDEEEEEEKEEEEEGEDEEEEEEDVMGN